MYSLSDLAADLENEARPTPAALKSWTTLNARIQHFGEARTLALYDLEIRGQGRRCILERLHNHYWRVRRHKSARRLAAVLREPDPDLRSLAAVEHLEDLKHGRA